ncbi:MAG TPA: PIN domain-containing protein [Candidatus Acidoferrum sp.]|nr:PIN domain-containing protein [Candidatus Acidoferrum sp.]
MRVVVDAGVVFSGAGWGGEAYLCLAALARRRVLAFATTHTLEELRRAVEAIGFKAVHSPYTILEWYYGAAKMVAPAPLGKQRSRDATDDPYLACALAASAQFIVSRDHDLLVLGKPFGIGIITPREMLTRLTVG